ncbi:interleukin-17 receptor E isoform X2 [Nerophis lumbriciformis]|uniref:interleukin-17 receptor E isoform X2 n=1 Tax=Nerophis lumbriciformis TaxID=546530 RepID=UPI002ADF6D47|nr:interleukin-17 receptor C-like isoform X2 [Nerophis lumbriciformis]
MGDLCQHTTTTVGHIKQHGSIRQRHLGFIYFKPLTMQTLRCVLWLGIVAMLVLVCPRLLDGKSFSCQRADQDEYSKDLCPVKTTRRDSNTKCVTVHVGVEDDDFSQGPTIEVRSLGKEIIRPVLKYKRTRKKWHVKKNPDEIRVWCNEVTQNRQPHSNGSLTLWELVYDCVMAEVQHPVTVSYSTTSMSCSINYTIPDPIPNFHLSVDNASKTFNLTVESEDKVHARWCYKQNAHYCIQGSHSNRTTIDPAQSNSALLRFPYLLPCVCVQVYYTFTDARRKPVCPFHTDTVAAGDLKIFASLCWRHHKQLCTPLLNSTLTGEEDGRMLIFNTSSVDKHPQMCVKFSLQGSNNISCPFQANMSSWQARVEPQQYILSVYLTSTVPATFSAQLCILTEKECAPRGHIFSEKAEATWETKIRVPLHLIAERPCVQVWQSDPALNGKRIMCPDYDRIRWGAQAVAILILLGSVAILGLFIHSLTKRGAADWLYIQKPVLLVCSSEQSAHISAACALASLLQGDLSATVHMALSAQSSQRQAGTGTAVADLGPLPWLYGQWEAVREAQGKVLIIWSPEAERTCQKWWERTRHCKDEESRVNRMEDDCKHDARRLGKPKKEDCVRTCKDKECGMQDSPSAVIEPVFTAALSCLEGALHERKVQEVAFVYFQGLGHSRDFPKIFRDVPRYCIPQDFSGLIQELGGMRRSSTTSWWHCWPRLVSKGMSVWLVRQLTDKLQTLLPQTHRTKGPKCRVKYFRRMMSVQNTQGTNQEHEALSQRTAEML